MRSRGWRNVIDIHGLGAAGGHSHALVHMHVLSGKLRLRRESKLLVFSPPLADRARESLGAALVEREAKETLLARARLLLQAGKQ